MKRLMLLVMWIVLGGAEVVWADAGKALNFEHDEAQYAEIPLTLPESGTVELWYKPETIYNYNTIFDNSTHENDWEMWIYESGKVRFRIEDGDLYYDLDDVGGTTNWHHIAVTWERHTMTNVNYDLWVNGIQRSSLTNTTWVDPGDTFYLAGGNSGNTTGDGMMDEVRIWSDVRTEDELVDHMYYELTGNEDDLLAYYPMNQTSGTNLTDAASGNYDGTLVNTTDDIWVLSDAPISSAPDDGDSTVHYVSTTGAAVWPYTNWVDAATNIQDAVDAAAANAIVRVARGTYTLNAEITVDKAITLEGVSGAAHTVISGQGAHRGFNLGGCACVLSGFTVTNGYAAEDGGGISCSDTTPVITNCIITGCTADDDGGGIAYGTVKNCTVSGNTCSDGGGGIYNTMAYNSLISGNSGKNGGSMCWGTAVNCTLVENQASNKGGGSYGSALINSIVWYNTADTAFDNLCNSEADYTCSPDVLHDTDGCITNNPLFVDRDAGSFRVESYSSCNNNGNNDEVVGAADLDAHARILYGVVDIGAYEHLSPDLIRITSELTEVGKNVEEVDLSGTVTESIVGTLTWTNHANGAHGTLPAETNWFAVNIPLQYSANRVTVSGTNVAGICLFDDITIVRDVEQHSGNSAVHYVSLDGGNVWPFTNWVDAAVNIQDAVDAAMSNDTVLVADGSYEACGEITPGYDLFNRVCITNDITVESVNGPDSTFIVGGGSTNGPDAVRGVYMEAGRLTGFTITDGRTLLDGDMTFDQSGGGIFCLDTTPIISHCTLSENEAYCGGGSYGGTLDNCVLSGNVGDDGGGSYSGTLNNCTVYGNTAESSAGGSYEGTLNNCIVYGNTAGADGDNWTSNSAPTFSFCCTTPLPDGVGNIAANPQFKDAANLNFRLQDESLCIDAGDSSLVTAATDFYGVDRILGAAVEMGAAEYLGEPVIEITTPNATVHTTVTNYTIEGINNEWVVGTMGWTNAANAASGEFQVSGLQFQVSSIPLEAGANQITVSGTDAFDVAVSDTVTITQTDLRTPDIGNIQRQEVDLGSVDQEPNSQVCYFVDGDSYLIPIVYKGKNTDGFSNIRMSILELAADGTITTNKAVTLVSEEFSDNTLSKPGLLALDDYRVLIIWADIVKYGEMEDFTYKGRIYDIKKGIFGEPYILNDMFSCNVFYRYDYCRVGFPDDNRVFFTYNYKIQINNLDHHLIKGQLLSCEGLEITRIGQTEDLYQDSQYVETVGNRAYSFPNDDRFMIMYATENAEERRYARVQVYQLDDSLTNGYRCVNDQCFYTAQTAYSLAEISISGVHGDSVVGASKVMVSWGTFSEAEDYAVIAHLTDDHQLVIDSTSRFASLSLSQSTGHSFAENQEYAWVTWNNDNNDANIDYTLLDLRGDQPVPMYAPLRLSPPNKERFWEDTPLTLPNGDLILIVDGDDGIARFLVLFFHIPVPSVALSATDTQGGEFGDTNLAFTVTQEASEPSYLEVDYALSGTASNGVDFSRLDGVEVFDVKRDTSTIAIDVLPDNESEGDETLTLQLLQGPGYKIGASTNAIVTIADRPMQDVLFHLVSDPALSAPDADADGDGVINLDEYYMGTSPTNAADHAALVTEWDGSLKIRFQRDKTQDDVTATFTWCRDLTEDIWLNSGESDGELTVTLTETIISDPAADPETVEVLVEGTPDPQPETIFVRMTIQ